MSSVWSIHRLHPPSCVERRRPDCHPIPPPLSPPSPPPPPSLPSSPFRSSLRTPAGEKHVLWRNAGAGGVKQVAKTAQVGRLRKHKTGRQVSEYENR